MVSRNDQVGNPITRSAPAAALLAVALTLGACGGGSGGPKTPDYTGPEDTIAFGADAADGSSGLYLIDASEAVPEAQARLLSAEVSPVRELRWSPDGTRLAYLVGEEAGEAQLRVADTETGDVATIGSGASMSAPAWSPDGTRLAYASDGTLYVRNLENEEVRVTEDVAALAVDWSSRDRLAVASEGGLFTDSPNGGDAQDVTSADAAGLRWSPDGKQLAYYGGTAELPEVFVVEPGTEPSRLTSGLRPVWSPDGKQVAYEQPAQEATLVTDIYAFALSDGEHVQLTQSVTQDAQASWSPDGSRIAYVAKPDLATGFLCIVVVAVRSGDCLDLPEGLQATSAAWSPH